MKPLKLLISGLFFFFIVLSMQLIENKICPWLAQPQPNWGWSYDRKFRLQFCTNKKLSFCKTLRVQNIRHLNIHFSLLRKGKIKRDLLRSFKWVSFSLIT